MLKKLVIWCFMLYCKNTELTIKDHMFKYKSLEYETPHIVKYFQLQMLYCTSGNVCKGINL